LAWAQGRDFSLTTHWPRLMGESEWELAMDVLRVDPDLRDPALGDVD
jgi:hypothetical protein